MLTFRVTITADGKQLDPLGVEADDALTAISVAKFRLYKEIVHAKTLRIETEIILGMSERAQPRT